MDEDGGQVIPDTSSGGGDVGDGTVTAMVIVCCAGAAVFSAIYFVFWRRSQHENNRSASLENNTTTAAENDSQAETETEFPNTATRRQPSSHLPASIAPSQKTTYALESTTERQPGDPIYDNYIISGTASLGVLLWIGASVVLIVSLIDRSDFDNARTDDFVSLGSEGCQILDAASYTYTDVKVNALNSLCVEEWEYNVLATATTVLEEDDVADTNSTTNAFISAPLTYDSCQGTCDVCLRTNKLFGKDYYVGVNPTERGVSIEENTTLLVECFAPTISVDGLSDFYNCGRQRSENGTCFLLQDAAVILEKEQLSVQVGLAVSYCGYAGGALLVCLAALFVRRNKQVRQRELSVLQTTETGTRDGDDEDKDGEVADATVKNPSNAKTPFEGVENDPAAENVEEQISEPNSDKVEMMEGC